MPRRTPTSAKVDPALAKDALEQAILFALDRHLDPELFEKCAADSLSSDYPSLTAVRGGSDGSFDGEFWTDNPQANPRSYYDGRAFDGTEQSTAAMRWILAVVIG